MKYNNVWYWDGALRDIYVVGVNISHWQQVVDWLNTGPYPLEFHLGDERMPLPGDVSVIFKQRNERTALLNIDVEGVVINCHFFWPKLIEFDIDPRQVDSDRKEEGIVDFLKGLGRALNKEVILTPENASGTPLLTYLPTTDELIHNPISLERTETIEMSREEGLRYMAKVCGVDEGDEEAVIRKMLEAGNKPA